MKRVLVTGASGFIGKAFLKEAADRGWQVAALSRSKRTCSVKDGETGHVTWMQGSLDDAPWREIAEFSPQICVHCAWISTPGLYLESPENLHLVGSSLDFLRRAAQVGVGYVLALGTCIEYEINGRESLSEQRSRVNPISLYARSKNALHRALQAEILQSDVRLGWGRVFYPYGVGEHPNRLCTSTIGKLMRGETLTLQTADSTKDYIEIRDLAGAIAMLCEQQTEGATNLGTGRGVTVFEIAAELGRLVGAPGLVQRASKASQDPYNHVVADNSKLRSTGWMQQISLEEGLRHLVANVNAGAES